MAFDGLNAEQYLRRAGFRPDHLVIDCPNKPLIENAFREILSTKGDTANHDLNYIGYLYLVLASIVDYSGNDSDTSNAHKYVKSPSAISGKTISATFPSKRSPPISPSTANISQRSSSARPEAPRWNI